MLWVAFTIPWKLWEEQLRGYASYERLSEQAGPNKSALLKATLTTSEKCASPADVLGVPRMSAASSSRSSLLCLLCLSLSTASLQASSWGVKVCPQLLLRKGCFQAAWAIWQNTLVTQTVYLKNTCRKGREAF